MQKPRTPDPEAIKISLSHEQDQPVWDVWTLLGMLWMTRWYVIRVTFVAALLSVVISLLIPNSYTATSRLLVPESGGLNPLAATLSRNLPSAASALIRGANTNYSRYLSILSSRQVTESVVDRFHLIDHYETKPGPYQRENTIQMFLDRYEIGIDKDYDYLFVSVTDEDPRLAAQIANFCVAQLNQINNALAVQGASRYRKYVEGRYEEANRQVDSLMNRVQQFQQTYGVFDLPVQAEGYFGQLAELRSEVVRLEIQQETMQSQFGSDNAQVLALQSAVQSARSKYQGALAGQERVLPVPQNELSALFREYVSLERDRQIQMRVLEIIAPLYEQARFDEEHRTEALQVVDEAKPPARKSAPRRAVIVIMTTLSAFAFSIVLALAFFWWRVQHRFIAERLHRSITRIQTGV